MAARYTSEASMLTAALRIMLDTNIYDQVVATNGLTEILQKLTDEEKIEILKTHIQEDELAAIPDSKKREAVQKIPGRKIPTGAAVWDVSKWGECKWGDGEGDIKFADIQKGNPRHSRDALIALTAAAEVDVLVTAEVKTLVNRIKASGSKLDVWDFDAFHKFIQKLNGA